MVKVNWSKQAIEDLYHIVRVIYLKLLCLNKELIYKVENVIKIRSNYLLECQR